MKMDLDVDSFISQQISQIAQSNTSRLGFPALITALCDIQGVVSNTLIFELLNPMINLAYITLLKKSYFTTRVPHRFCQKCRNRSSGGNSVNK